MAEFLELIAAIVWLGLGIYGWHTARQLRKRMDKVVTDIEADVEREINGGPW